MTTRSVPAGNVVSACQSIAGSRPDTSLSVRAMSRSRLMPGKTTTADFMAVIWNEQPRRASSFRHLDAVILDHGIGEQLVGRLLQGRRYLRFVAALNFDVEHLALADAGYAVDAERTQRAFDGLALRIKHAGFQRDGNMRLHDLPFSRVATDAKPAAWAAAR